MPRPPPEAIKMASASQGVASPSAEAPLYVSFHFPRSPEDKFPSLYATATTLGVQDKLSQFVKFSHRCTACSLPLHRSNSCTITGTTEASADSALRSTSDSERTILL